MSVPTGSSNNPYGITLFTVQTPSGSDLFLQTQEEAIWYQGQRDRYLADNAWPNVSDIQDLDRLLMLEVLVHRWGIWMGQGFDYLAARVDESSLKDNLQKFSVEIRQLKAALGIDKVSRDKDKGSSLADYTENLLRRAKQLGYHRNEQYALAVTKMWELRSMVVTHDRCDDEERRLLDVSEAKIVDWIRRNLIADWDKTAEDFRKNQAMWIRELA